MHVLSAPDRRGRVRDVGFPCFDVDPGGFRDRVAQLVAPGHRARKRAADADVRLPRRLPAEHRVERDQLEDIDRLQLQLLARSR